MRRSMLFLILVLVACYPASLAAETQKQADIKGLWLTADYPVATVRAGEEARFNLSLINRGLAPQRASLSVERIPEGWTVELRGGGRAVGAAFVDYNDKSSLDLKVKIPPSAKPGQYPVLIKAATSEATYELPLTLTVEEREEAALTAEPKLPTLRGTPRSTFDYRVTVKNDSADTMQVTLSAEAPRGFQVTFKESYGTQELTSLPIKAGESKDLAIDIKPPQNIAAGKYPVVVTFAGDKAKAQTRLVLDVTGQPSVTLAGENDRLSGEATAGTEKRFNFVVRNSGTAEARDISLTISAPTGWKAAFEPKEVPLLAPGAEEKVVAVVTPGEKALAGDYVMSLRASGDGISESVNYRVTVVTSTMWGVVGLGVIAISLLVLLGAVGRFGRR